MINKKIIIAIVIIIALAIVYRTVTIDCGPGCTTDPEKIAAGCPACPTQRHAHHVVEQTAECADCLAPTEDFFHDGIYTGPGINEMV